MKTLLITSLFCLSALGSFAQSANDEAAERQQIHDRAMAIYCRTNGNMGSSAAMRYKTDYSNVHAAFPDAPKNATPSDASGDHLAATNAPCYRYKNSNGRYVTKCPNTTSAKCTTHGTALNEDETATNLDGSSNFQAHRSYTGNYPDLHAVYPQAPANAIPVWPSGEYTELQNPPCYRYINRRGLVVTECPGAQFAPEHRYR